jgi:hypothetical protein
MPAVVAQMILSKSISRAGRTKITDNILIIAPRAISIHIELIISISEYTATPNVAANRPIPDTMIDGTDAARAVVIDSLLFAPPIRSLLYRVVIKIA